MKFGTRILATIAFFVGAVVLFDVIQRSVVFWKIQRMLAVFSAQHPWVMIGVGALMLAYSAYHAFVVIGWRSGVGQRLRIRDQVAYGCTFLGLGFLLWGGIGLR